MTHQLTFDLPVRQALGREDFFVSPSNATALATLSDTQNWPLGKMVLCGDAGAGKTHLAHVWASETGGKIVAAHDITKTAIASLALGPLAVEDADLAAGDADFETELFHLHNLIHANGHPLLLTAQKPPSRWNLSLADLKSRMEGTSVTQLEAPDDMLLIVVMLKHFSDRQMHVAPETVDFIIKRAPRSLGFIRELCTEIDKAALSEKRAVTRPFAAKVLDALDKNRPEGA